MLYNRHSDTELERAVYIDPTNQAARAEQLARIPALLDNRSDETQDLEMQLEISERERKQEVAAVEEDLAAAEKHARELQQELDEAHDRIAELTRAEDLV
ncbi:MAG: hypothetical protein ACXU8N_18300 [Telluria sp.]